MVLGAASAFHATALTAVSGLWIDRLYEFPFCAMKRTTLCCRVRPYETCPYKGFALAQFRVWICQRIHVGDEGVTLRPAPSRFSHRRITVNKQNKSISRSGEARTFNHSKTLVPTYLAKTRRVDSQEPAVGILPRGASQSSYWGSGNRQPALNSTCSRVSWTIDI